MVPVHVRMLSRSLITTESPLRCRHIVAVMLTTCFLVNGLLLFNFFIAIVAMSREYQWDGSQQSHLLAAYYVGAVVAKVPSGAASDVLGPKVVITVAMALASLLTALTPLLTAWSFAAVLVCRVLVGITLGSTLSPCLPLLSRWVGANDRPKYATCVLAISLGGAVANPLCGLLISRYGWRSVFYVTAAVGAGWVLAWMWLVHDTPASHPRISEGERERIAAELQAEEHDRSVGNVSLKQVPWRRIAISVPVLALSFNFACFNLGTAITSTQLPIFFDGVMELSIDVVGLLTSMPYVGSYVGALTFGYLSFLLQSKSTLGTTALRKGFVSVSLLGPGLLMLVQAFYGQVLWVSALTFTTAAIVSGAICGGQVPNPLDLAPNFSGIISGIVYMWGTIPGCFAPALVAALVEDPTDFGQWKTVYMVMFGFSLVGMLVYAIFGSGTAQSWNTVEETPEIAESPTDGDGKR